MEKNEIKKALYREKPLAKRVENTGRDEYYYLYHTIILGNKDIFFKVPISDMGDNLFDSEISAQFLIRWVDLN